MQPGDTITVTVTPRASRGRIVEDGGRLRVYVTEAPEKGRATEAARKALAAHLGLPKTALDLVRGAASREKTFRRV
ncbi:DUF167 domain-containing protein [Mangrovicoccus algicola]|nr:DUF167 domain-containing protein [Mangrovicoccus algicola]